MKNRCSFPPTYFFTTSLISWIMFSYKNWWFKNIICFCTNAFISIVFQGLIGPQGPIGPPGEKVSCFMYIMNDSADLGVCVTENTDMQTNLVFKLPLSTKHLLCVTCRRLEVVLWINLSCFFLGASRETGFGWPSWCRWPSCKCFSFYIIHRKSHQHNNMLTINNFLSRVTREKKALRARKGQLWVTLSFRFLSETDIKCFCSGWIRLINENWHFCVKVYNKTTI